MDSVPAPEIVLAIVPADERHLDALMAGASELFLEVREDNEPAKYLYNRAGFVQVGRRADYYTANDGNRRAAITMRYSLEQLVG